MEKMEIMENSLEEHDHNFGVSLLYKDGDNNYSSYYIVIARNLEQAEKEVNKKLRKWWGPETEVKTKVTGKQYYQPKVGYPVVELQSIRRVDDYENLLKFVGAL